MIITTATTTTITRTRARTLTLSSTRPPKPTESPPPPMPTFNSKTLYNQLTKPTAPPPPAPPKAAKSRKATLPSPYLPETSFSKPLKPIIRPSTLNPISSLLHSNPDTQMAAEVISYLDVWELLVDIDKEARIEIGKKRAEVLHLAERIGELKGEQVVQP